MSAEPNFAHSYDIVNQLLSEIRPHTKYMFVTNKNASYETMLSIPFILDYCKFFVIFNPSKSSILPISVC